MAAESVCGIFSTKVNTDFAKHEAAEAGQSVSDDANGGLKLTRRTLCAGLVASVATPAFASAPAILSGRGKFRSLKLNIQRTGEKINTVYWIDGEYIPEAVDAISYILRDWRLDAVKPFAPATLDILSAAHRMLECPDPIEIISGYRTEQTNAMLRSRSRGVARNSYHIKAMAVDLRIPSRSVRQIAAAGKALSAGGVGAYSRSNFVHLDSGPVRDWGR